MNPHPCQPNSRVTLVALAAFAGSLIAGPAAAQQAAYPTRAVSLVVPFTPGSTVDISARTFGRDFSKRLGQPVNIENRPGVAAFRAVKSATPDGHTLMWHSGGATIAQTVLKEPDFDIRKDFLPISMVARGPLALFVKTDSPFKSAKDMIEFARRNPGKLNYGSTGVGSTLHLVSEIFKGVARVDIVNVPYKGGNDAVTALLSGQIDVLFFDASFILGGGRDKTRIIALTAKERSPFFPEIPTMAESGGPEFDVAFWLGMFAPAGTPRAVVDRLNGMIRESLRAPELQEYLKKQTYVAAWMTPEDMQKLVVQEVEQWTRVVRDVGVPLQ